MLDRSVGYEIGENVTVKSAAKSVIKRVEYCISELEYWRRPAKVAKFYIGKTVVPEMKTWTLELTKKEAKGVIGRLASHLRKDFGKDGLIVLTTMNKHCIPEECKNNEYFCTTEEYALMVGKRVIQHFLECDRERIANPSTYPGKLGKLGDEESLTQGIYMSFTMKGKVIISIERYR